MAELLSFGNIRMKPLHLISSLTVVLLTCVLAGCSHHDSSAIPLPEGAVVFENSGIVLVPGDNWKQLRSGDFTGAADVCLPVLQGYGQLEGGVIQVYSSPSDRSDPQARAASMRKATERHPQIVKDSFKQEAFATDSGIKGIHISYDVRVEKDGHSRIARTHVYIVQNRKGSCVGITYHIPTEADSKVVHEMIRKTLRWQ